MGLAYDEDDETIDLAGELDMSDVERILTEIGAMRGDLGGVRHELGEVKTEVASVRAWQENKQGDIARFYATDWTKMQSRVEKLEGQQTEDVALRSRLSLLGTIGLILLGAFGSIAGWSLNRTFEQGATAAAQAKEIEGIQGDLKEIRRDKRIDDRRRDEH